MPRKKKEAPAREITRAISLDEWAKDREKRNQLIELLQHPVLREAVLTLETSYAASVPSYIAIDGTPSSIPNAGDLNNLLALRHIHRAGFFGFLHGLRNLTKERVLKRAEKAPWGDLVPETAD